MADAYYVRIRGRVSGPFGEDKLATLVQRGQLSRAHEVSEDGQVWMPAGDLPQLFVKHTKAAHATPERATTNLTDDATATTGAGPSNESNAEKWYYAIEGQKTGPLSWTDLQSKAIGGAIPQTALVWTQGMTNWQAAASIPGLFLQTTSGPRATEEIPKRQIPWSELLPVFRVLNDGSWSLAWVQCLAIALLFPLLALEYHGRDDIHLAWAALVFSLYFSLLWTAFFHWCISPSRVSAWRVLGAWVFTATLGILGVLVVGAVPQVIFADALDDSSASLFKRVVGWIAAVGLIEEGGKLLSVLALTYHIKADKLPRTCAFIGVVSGLAFGTIEAVGYTQVYVAQHKLSGGSTEDAYGMLFFTLMLRWICLPLLHAVWTGISGFFVGLSYHAQTGKWGWVVLGLFVAAVLHGVYDAGAADKTYSWLTLVSATVSLSLLVGYLRSEGTLIARIEKYRRSPASTT